MRTTLAIAGVVAVILTVRVSAGADALSPKETHYTASQIKRMIREAHSPDQYRVIAQYYDERHREFSQKAADEKVEWMRRSQNTTSLAAKYPRPVDEARNLYEYYAYEADQAAVQSDKYNGMAANTTVATK